MLNDKTRLKDGAPPRHRTTAGPIALSFAIAVGKRSTADEPRGIVRRMGHSRTVRVPYFGGMPMTLTPAPRAWSIAKITLLYVTIVSPLTKMIFSGRGS